MTPFQTQKATSVLILLRTTYFERFWFSSTSHVHDRSINLLHEIKLTSIRSRSDPNHSLSRSGLFCKLDSFSYHLPPSWIWWSDQVPERILSERHSGLLNTHPFRSPVLAWYRGSITLVEMARLPWFEVPDHHELEKIRKFRLPYHHLLQLLWLSL